MINLELRKYIECTREEKKPLLKLVAEITHLANITRMEGVLALDKKIEELDDRLLQTGLGLIVDGTDPEIVKEIMDNKIITSFKTGAELLSQLIIRDGSLAIQCGYNPRIIEHMMLALLGDEFTLDDMQSAESDVAFLYEGLIAEFEVFNPEKGLEDFEKLINLEYRDMQHLIRETDLKELSIALRGATAELRKHFLSNVSKNLCVAILSDMKYMGPVRQADIHAAQQKILDILRRLIEAGEIVFPKG